MADLWTFGPANVTTLITTTQENRDNKDIQDAVFNKLALFEHLNKKKKVYRGGTSITGPIQFQNSVATGSYSGYETLNVQPTDDLTMYSYKWKQYYGSMTVNGREDRVINKGKPEIISLVKTKIDGAESALRNKLNTDLFAASPAANDIGSLVTSIDATSSIGDINSTTYSFWQSTSTASGSFAAQGLSDMRTLWNTLNVRNSVPDLLLTTSAIHGYYEASLVPQQRYTASDSTGNASFEDLKFKSAAVRFDAQATSGVMYFLNSDVMHLAIDPSTDFITTEWVKPFNQDAKSAQILVALELVVKNRRKLGKLTSITA